MSHKCEKCGEEFDSERGLHIHQGRKHSEENHEENNERQVEGREGITLGIKQFGAATFAFGLLLGVIVGAGAGGALNIEAPEQVEAPGGDNNNQGSDTGSQGSSTVDVSQIEMEGEPVLGQEDAPVTMVVYEDFQCPFCKRFEEGAVSQVESQYVESGQVKIVWKDFPLEQIHPQATASAEVMECVYRQDNDTFWEVKKTIFANQESLYPRGTTEKEVKDKIIQWASQEGVSEEAVRSCLENGNPGDEVESDLQEGQGFDTTISTPQGDRQFVSGTPGTVIYGEGDSDGEPIVGAQPFSAVESVIENKLES